MKDLAGNKYGRLTVLHATDRPPNHRDKKVWWLCECDCGNTVAVIGERLRNGQTKSCGCYRLDVSREVARKLGKTSVKHGLSRTRVYKIYKNMLRRCNNKAANHYELYGGRGITVCKEWENSIECFYNWAISNGYSDDKTLDRIDGNRGYSPDNCRWATIEQQANNKSNNVWINDNGEKITISQFARKYGLTKACVWGRYRNGWTIEEMKQKSRRA